MNIRLKEWREKRNLSQAQLGRKVGVEQQMISRWEADAPDALDLLRRLAKALGVQMEDLFDE